MKSRFFNLLVLVVMISVLAACGGDNGADGSGNETQGREFLTIVTGGTGGTYYPLGGAVANIINSNIDNTRSNVESTGGSVANIRLLSDKEAQLAFVSADSAYYAYSGTEFFEGEDVHDGLRAIASLYPEVIQVVTTEAAGVKSFDELVGKRVAVGAAGSGTELSARIVLNAHDISYDDIQEDFLSFGEVTTGLQDGHIAAGFVWAGLPTSSIVDLASLNKINLLPIQASRMGTILNDFPFYNEVVIPANTYNGQTEDIETIAANALLITTSDMDEELVYEITKYLFENVDAIAAAHVRGEDITLETALDGVAIPLHPGTIRYYEEVGVDIPDNLR
ncbi:TAXI family TRAP transporter solute-binding subunit [Bacillaceae bacterium IKA-2]|nr:TAXI family TRAP transporter solute-binding subunit [Bacillaceae bacterium IKA-2]